MGGWPACFAPLAPLAFGEGQGPDDGGARCAPAWRGRAERKRRGFRQPVEREAAQSRGARDSRELSNDSEGASSWFCMKSKARQREFGFMGWGGKRRGAGRKPAGERAGVSHTKREKLAPRFPVLVTMRVRAGLASLRADDVHELLRRIFAAASSADFRTIEYSVQSNHVHVLVEASDERALTRGMIGLAVRIARALNRLWRRAGAIFSDRFHARYLRSPREVRNALVYVLQNARKHGSWRASRPDEYSSGTCF